MFLERVVILSAVLVALSALAHPAVSATRVFGIYRPREIYAYARGHYGPLLNTNHLAAYLNVGACVALGAVATKSSSMPRTLAVAAVVLLAGTSVWAASRGGTGALVVGAVLTLGLAAWNRRGADTSRVETTLILVVTVAAAILVGFGTSEFAREDLANWDVSKVFVAQRALLLVPKSPFLGFGRGTFETVFPLVKDDPLYVTFTHPENVVAQWLVEWGLPVSIAGALLLGAALRPRTLLRSVRPAIGAWAALVACVLHDLVDFHLEVPAVVALLAACTAMVVGGRAVSTSTGGRQWSMHFGRAVALGAVGASVLAAWWVLPDAGHTVAEDRRQISALAGERDLSAKDFRDTLHAAMARYPAEGFFPLMGAFRAQQSGEGSVVPWVGRALELNPRLGRAHLVLARALARSRPSQARLEYRLAYTAEVGLRTNVLEEAVSLVQDFDSALELVPSETDEAAHAQAVQALDDLATRIAPKFPSTAARLDEELRRRAPEARGVLLRAGRAVLSDLQNDHPWCSDRRACAREALDGVRRLSLREPNLCEPYALRTRLEIATGEAGANTLAQFDQATEAMTDGAKCRRDLVDLAIAMKERVRAQETLARVVRGGCGPPEECRGLYFWAGSKEEQLGNTSKALAMYHRALDVVPDDDELQEHAARLAMKAGFFAAAIEGYGRLATRHPDNPRWSAAVREVTSRATERQLADPR